MFNIITIISISMIISSSSMCTTIVIIIIIISSSSSSSDLGAELRDLGVELGDELHGLLLRVELLVGLLLAEAGELVVGGRLGLALLLDLDLELLQELDHLSSV